MPHFAMICTDKVGALDLRLATREAHLAYTRDFPDLIRLAGPFLSEAGEMRGSLFLIDAVDIETVRAFNAADPYTLAGLFAEIKIMPWRATIGTLP